MKKGTFFAIMSILSLVLLFGIPYWKSKKQDAAMGITTIIDTLQIEEVDIEVVPLNIDTVSINAGAYKLIVGSFIYKRNAEMLIFQLQKHDIVGEIVEAVVFGWQRYRVSVGGYDTLQEAVNQRNKIRPYCKDAWIAKY